MFRDSVRGISELLKQVIYLYGVRLVMFDGVSAPQCPGKGELRGGWIFISFL